MDRNFPPSTESKMEFVALRKESVDRNGSRRREKGQRNLSLSARRAWIEIPRSGQIHIRRRVALRKESVDRNADGAVSGSCDYGRSPQGERG